MTHHPAASCPQAGKDLPVERHQGAYALQKQLMEAVAADRHLTALGGDAFRWACIRGGLVSGWLPSRHWRPAVWLAVRLAGCRLQTTVCGEHYEAKRRPVHLTFFAARFVH